MSHEGIRIVPKDKAAREKRDNRPLPRIAITPEKVRVLITEGKGMEIDWVDGHQQRLELCLAARGLPLRHLRRRARKPKAASPASPSPSPPPCCPCIPPPPKPASAHPVGRYAIQFNWQDGHSGGIYSWDYLRRVCQCPECTFAAEETTGTPN